jgi:TetR/AcrR family transcriptional regulator
MTTNNDTRTKIISAAIKVFAEKGKHGARMEEIAVRASVNKAMLYYYYTSKEILFKEVLKTILGKITANIIKNTKQIIENSNDPIEIVEGFIHAHNKAFSRNSDYTKVLLIAIVNTPEEFREVMEVTQPDQIFPQKLMDIFEQGISQNNFRNVDPMQVFISIIGTNLIYFIGKPIAEILMNLEVQDEQAFLRKREDSVVDLLLYGLVKKKSSNA